MSAEKKSNRKIFIIGGIVAGIMFAFCFAMVPLYGLICKKTGLNTTISTDTISREQAAQFGKKIDTSRDILVQFTATNHMGMPWDFYPKMKSIVVHPGQQNKVIFYAKNPTGRDMVAQAIPGMAPVEAIAHFHKIECFCFNQTPLKAGEDRDLVMVFQIDNDLPKEVHTITLAYTLFDATPSDKKKA